MEAKRVEMLLRLRFSPRATSPAVLPGCLLRNATTRALVSPCRLGALAQRRDRAHDRTREGTLRGLAAFALAVPTSSPAPFNTTTRTCSKSSRTASVSRPTSRPRFEAEDRVQFDPVGRHATLTVED